jgi:hypothetical protein
MTVCGSSSVAAQITVGEVGSLSQDVCAGDSASVQVADVSGPLVKTICICLTDFRLTLLALAVPSVRPCRFNGLPKACYSQGLLLFQNSTSLQYCELLESYANVQTLSQHEKCSRGTQILGELQKPCGESRVEIRFPTWK